MNYVVIIVSGLLAILFVSLMVKNLLPTKKDFEVLAVESLKYHFDEEVNYE